MMRAVVYRMTVGDKLISQTVDFVMGDRDPGENQARSNLLYAAIDAGLDPTPEDLSSFERIEVQR